MIRLTLKEDERIFDLLNVGCEKSQRWASGFLVGSCY